MKRSPGGRHLLSEKRLMVFEENGVDFVDIVIMMLNEPRDDQIRGTAGRQGDSRSCQQIFRCRKIQLQGNAQSNGGFLLRRVGGIAADAGEQPAVDVGFLIYGHIIHATLINQFKQLLLEGFLRVNDKLIRILNRNRQIFRLIGQRQVLSILTEERSLPPMASVSTYSFCVIA